jgi:type VI secretion system protein ImpE
MRFDDQLRAGKIDDALLLLQDQVRSQPANAALRASMFQVYSLIGQWERAQTQLKVLADLDAQGLLIARLYEPNLLAETFRENIVAGKTGPVIFGEPETWMAALVRGNELAARHEYSAARGALQDALDAAPSSSGTINGAPFPWLADADLRFGPMLEAVVDGRYFWVPFFRIRQLRVKAPNRLRDLIWLPAGFVWSNGGEANGFIFARYPGTAAVADNELRLSRKTAWTEKSDGFAVGLGQRLLTTEADDYAILDIRSIDLGSETQTTPETPAPG